LYTTNREITFSPRCFLCLNAREPQFKRDDVASRLLLFRVETLDACMSEYKIYDNLLKHRNDLWSELIRDLNVIVGALAADTEPFTSKWRMADWASLGWRISRTENAGDTFIGLLDKMKVSQAEFLLEDNPIAECLEYWLQEPANVGREVTSGELYKEFLEVAEEYKVPFEKGCNSPSVFGRKVLISPAWMVTVVIETMPAASSEMGTTRLYLYMRPCFFRFKYPIARLPASSG